MEPKYRRPLNTKQKQILLVLYKFRFGTLEQLHHYQGIKSVTATTVRLKILVEQGYLGRNYNGKYRVQGWPATYYLRLKALNWLKTQPQASPNVIKTIYNNDNRASEAFISHSLAIFSLYLKLLGSEFKFFSKSELSAYEYFPKQLPDAYLSRREPQEQLINDIFVSYIAESMAYFVVRKRFKQMIAYYNSDEWEGSDQMPAWLIVCQSEKLEKRLSKNLSKLVDEDSEMNLFVTTLDEAGDMNEWQQLSASEDG
jgi:hypothetical protein